MSPTGRVAVYYAYGADDALLYVGTSVNPTARLGVHRRRSAWWAHATRIEVQWYPSSEAASAEEYRVIRECNPTFNKAGISAAYCPHFVPAPKLRGKTFDWDGLAALRTQRAAKAAIMSDIDTEIASLIRQAIDEKHGPTEIARELGITRARVYQIIGR